MRRSAIILTIYQAGQKLQTIQVSPGEERVFTIGSKAGFVEIVIPSPLVSRVHAQLIVNANGDISLIDNGSTNGTFIGTRRIPTETITHLDPGQSIYFGGESGGKLVISEADSSNSSERPQGGQNLMNLLQQKQEVTLGRGSDCDVVIQSTTASRLHAKLRLLKDGKIVLIDLNSTNGTFLNGQRVTGTVGVKPGDQIIIGRSLISLDHGQQSLSGEISIRTEGIRKDFPNGKTGLRETSVEIQAGKLIAIMGPSGCGKSTFLKCLTGEAPPTRGRVYLYNMELIQHYDFLKTLIGYVPQDDIVHKELTVEQSLYFAARLRMEKPTAKDIETKIKEVLARLHISHIRHSPIAKISGGQRKRVSIAVELLTDPLILFLDEPTSPLDPQTIEEFLKILQELAHKGTTVIMVTHKPEDLEYMDSVIFMAEGGSIVYEGSTQQYKSYFGVRTAVEVYANICGEKAQKWIQQYRGKESRPTSSSQQSNPRLVKRSDKNIFDEFQWLFRRYFRIKSNDLMNMLILIGQAPIIASLVCLIFDQLTISVPFLVTLSAIWFGTSNAAREIVAEAAIYRRERMFNLRIGPYILSKIAVLSLFGGIQAFLFSFIILIGFENADPGWSNFPMTFIWVWIITVCATLLGLTISSVVNTVEKAMTIVPLVLIPQIMLAGAVARITQPVVEVMSYFSPTRWGNERLCMIQGSLFNTQVEGLDSTDAAYFLSREDSIISARDLLAGQYHDNYEDLFGHLAYTFRLDLAAITVISLILLTVLVIAMRRKDSI